MAAVPMLAGVGLMMVCCSSSSAMMMMGGDDDSSGAGAGAGAGAGTPAAKTTTTFVGSEIPNDAMVIDVGEIPMAYMEGDAVIGDFNAPAGSTATTRTHYLQFQSDGQLVWVKTGTGTAWAMGSNITMPGTTVSLQGDGNLCAYGSDINRVKCGMTHDPNVPAGQHRLVGTKEGLLYVDHGTGVSGRSVIYDPSSTTETYVLPY